MYVRILIAALAITLSSPLSAETDRPRPDRPRAGDPMMGKLFPPDMIMRNRRDLQLTDRQSRNLVKLIQEFQQDNIEAQWEVSEARDRLAALMDEDRLDKDEIEKALTRLHKLQNDMQLKQVMMMVGIRNELNAEQVKMLTERRGSRAAGLRDRRNRPDRNRMRREH